MIKETGGFICEKGIIMSKSKKGFIAAGACTVLAGAGVLIEVIFGGSGGSFFSDKTTSLDLSKLVQQESYASALDVPEYEGEPYVVLDGNKPDFAEEELVTNDYEDYSELDRLGRCGAAEACIGEELMPDEKRGDISSVKPTGWQSVRYENVDGESLYNRCHLIGYQLSGENANEKNLITGTRYMNTIGMLPFEDLVAEYVHETRNHVLYRVTPIFEGENLVASGVQMEAESVEDDGKGVKFNVYVYNIQPDIVIDYATGDNYPEEHFGTIKKEPTTQLDAKANEEGSYILNPNTYKFHRPECSGVDNMKEENKKKFTGKRKDIIKQGYKPCGKCKP